ncbi:hypothetical protein [Desulfovibrio psychrotolerans]|uniref:Uncharacterized protein n=1 Tax=Desulfovibrio psychrotolerans TaxID=415242 RepID=A0A7J0BU03_9BACT|nr:hypothetical protein [Desulfovibrio psychrotolerans]GFM36652.1 hypothetical protein DSM19430T_13360 [Desulfovibrio psychrotolerans]
MYINLVFGVLVLAALYFLGRELARRLRSPRAILQEELDERRRRTQRIQENLQRVRARAMERLVPVRKAVREMNASLLAAQRFAVEETDDAVRLRLDRAVLTVTYQLASFSVDGSPDELGSEMAQYERFLIEIENTETGSRYTREAVTHEEAIRLLAREIAVQVQN